MFAAGVGGMFVLRRRMSERIVELGSLMLGKPVRNAFTRSSRGNRSGAWYEPPNRISTSSGMLGFSTDRWN